MNITVVTEEGYASCTEVQLIRKGKLAQLLSPSKTLSARRFSPRPVTVLMPLHSSPHLPVLGNIENVGPETEAISPKGG